MPRLMMFLAAGVASGIALAGAALAQSTGASPADPNNERNMIPAPSNEQPSDPAANNNPAARIPTDPQDRMRARAQQGGAAGTGAGTGEAGVDMPPAPVIPGAP